MNKHYECCFQEWPSLRSGWLPPAAPAWEQLYHNLTKEYIAMPNPDEQRKQSLPMTDFMKKLLEQIPTKTYDSFIKPLPKEDNAKQKS